MSQLLYFQIFRFDKRSFVFVQQTLPTGADFRSRLQTGTFHDVFRDRHVGNRGRTPSSELPLHIANHFRVHAEALQEGANLLHFVKRTNASYTFTVGVVGHERYAKSRSNATDRTVNPNCPFISHVLCLFLPSMKYLSGGRPLHL